MHQPQITSRDARTAYRAAAGAYRARQGKLSAIGMAYESRPASADEATERSAMDRRVAALPLAKAPVGFDRDDRTLIGGRDRWTDTLSWSRTQTVRCMRDAAAELRRRAAERAECNRLRLDLPRYATPDSALQPAALIAAHLRVARGAVARPLAALAQAERDIATDALMRAGFRAASVAGLLQVAA